MKGKQFSGCLFVVTTLTSCGQSGSLEPLPSGCYWFDEETPLFKLEGNRARIMVKTDVNYVNFTRTRQHTVVSQPAFYIVEAEDVSVEKNLAMRKIALPITATSPPTIGIPYAPHGSVDVKLGRPC